MAKKIVVVQFADRCDSCKNPIKRGEKAAFFDEKDCYRKYTNMNLLCLECDAKDK